MPLKTPKEWISLGTAGTLLVALQPAFSFLHYFWSLRMGAYPVNSDSIGIPIYNEFLSWLIVAPIALCGIWWAVWDYHDAKLIFGWNRKRPTWSLFWTVLSTILIVGTVLELTYALSWMNLPSIINLSLWICLFLCLRAVVVFKRFLVT